MAMPVTVPRYTIEDLESFPDDGNRYELLAGVLLVTPLAEFPHQRAAARLLAELVAYLRSDRIAEVFSPGSDDSTRRALAARPSWLTRIESVGSRPEDRSRW